MNKAIDAAVKCLELARDGYPKESAGYVMYQQAIDGLRQQPDAPITGMAKVDQPYMIIKNEQPDADGEAVTYKVESGQQFLERLGVKFAPPTPTDGDAGEVARKIRVLVLRADDCSGTGALPSNYDAEWVDKLDAEITNLINAYGQACADRAIERAANLITNGYQADEEQSLRTTPMEEVGGLQAWHEKDDIAARVRALKTHGG
jgi:hypothetical protein